MYLLTILDKQMPIYLNRKPQKFSQFWGKLFVFFVLVASNSVSAQIHVSENTTLSVTENAYIYTETEVVGNHNAVALYKDSGILLVAQSKTTPKEKPTNQKTKQNALEHSKKNLAKTEKPTAEKSVYQITSQPTSKNFLTGGIEKSIAVVTTYYRAIAIVPHTFIIKNQNIQNTIPVFGRVVNVKSKNDHITQKIRPPPLSFRA